MDTSKISQLLRKAVDDELAAAGVPKGEVADAATAAVKDGPFLLVMVLSGALSPPHRGHTEMLKVTGTCVEQQTHGKWRFIGGLLSPSSHSYVAGKLGINAVKEHYRNLMCEVATQEDEPLIGVAPLGIASGNGVCEHVLDQLRAESKQSESIPHALPPYFPWHRLKIIPVYGSDFLVKYRAVVSEPRVIATRKDEEGTAQKALDVLKEQQGRIHDDFLFVHLPDGAVPDYSSTAVRNALHDVEVAAGTPVGAKADAFLREALHPAVVEILRKTPQDQLYHNGGKKKQKD